MNAPMSKVNPSRLIVWTRPPTRSWRSNTTGSRPAFVKAWAALTPAIPAPTIAVSLVGVMCVPPLEGRRGTGDRDAGAGARDPRDLPGLEDGVATGVVAHAVDHVAL